MKWTNEQYAAITDEGGTLLVSAAAGSGKTAVLVERAVRLLSDTQHPIAADRLLIVTFTRAAAEELKGRIAARLQEEQAKSPNSVYLRKQRLLLGRSYICTIDAFCMQLLKLYFAELDLPPDFDKADDALVKTLREQAVSEVLEEMYLSDAFCKFAAMYGRSRSDLAAKTAILSLYDFLRSSAFPKATVNNIISVWAEEKSLCDTVWGDALLQSAQGQIKSALALLEAANQTAVSDENMAEKYAPAIMGDISFLNEVLALLTQKRWNDAGVYAGEYSPLKFKPVKGADEIVESVKSLREKAKKIIKALPKDVFVCTEEEFLQDKEIALPMVQELCRAAQLFEKIFYEKKLEEKVLEYSDFEHIARTLLCDENGEKTALARQISAQFDEVMVDEYQDTNELQALLYSCLANEDNSNLFMVGDVKQSVYRFRLAQPQIFIDKKDSFEPYSTKKHPAVLNLGHNFRSAQNVIEQINFVFENVMCRELGGVEYNDNEHLVKGSDDAYNGGDFEIHVIDTNGESAQNADAGTVAKIIDKMIKEKFEVRSKTGVRPCVYGDFCVLLRSRGGFLSYATALENLGIPTFADTGENVLTSPEISPFLSLLRIIDNPGQDVFLAAVMLSAMYGFTPTELTQLRAELPKKSLYAALLSSKSSKAISFCDDLKFYRTIAASAPFGEVCDAIMQKTHFMAAVSAMREGASRKESLRSFIAYATEGCKATGGLSSFLRRIDVLDGTIPQEQLSAGGLNAVKIMTIHKSKGLEFPVCILADTHHHFNMRDISNPILFDTKLGLGISLRQEEGNIYRTASHKAIAQTERGARVSEEMRILYVALTRAKDKLIATMAFENSQNFLSDIALSIFAGGQAAMQALLSASSMATWLCAAAFLHPDCENLRGMCAFGHLPSKQTHSRMRVVFDKFDQDESEQNLEEEKQMFLPDEQLVYMLNQNFSRAQAQNLQEKTPVKLSVSSLAKSDAPVVLQRPSFMYSEGLTAAEQGTALHAVLQFANFENAKQNLDNELERLSNEAYILPEVIEKINKTAFKAFLNSSLCGRMLKSKIVYKEYDFLTWLTDTQPKQGENPVLVQGIADIVIINNNQIEIADYKTDKGKTEKDFITQYKGQLSLYADAISKRFGLKVTRLTIYSFTLNKEIDVPF